MAREDLQRYINVKEGLIVSEGTLRTADLLMAAYDEINGWSLDKEDMKKEILSMVEYQFGWGYNIREDKEEDAEYLWNETVFNYFNEIAPEGYYFGSSEGDGACIGWFKYEEEM